MVSSEGNGVQAAVADEGFYFDTRPGAPRLFHTTERCEVGRAIPNEYRARTFDYEALHGLKECAECREATLGNGGDH